MRRTGSRDKDGILLYLGYDDAPMGQYRLTVTGLNDPYLWVETFYDVSDMQTYADHFGLTSDFIEFPVNHRGHRIQHRPVARTLGQTDRGEFVCIRPCTEDVGAYLVFVRSRERHSGGDYTLTLTQE